MDNLRVVCIASDTPYKDISKPTVVEVVSELTPEVTSKVPDIGTIAGKISDGYWINSKTYHGELNLKGPKAKELLDYLIESDHSPLVGTIHNGVYRVFSIIKKL